MKLELDPHLDPDPTGFPMRIRMRKNDRRSTARPDYQDHDPGSEHGRI